MKASRHTICSVMRTAAVGLGVGLGVGYLLWGRRASGAASPSVSAPEVTSGTAAAPLAGAGSGATVSENSSTASTSNPVEGARLVCPQSTSSMPSLLCLCDLLLLAVVATWESVGAG